MNSVIHHNFNLFHSLESKTGKRILIVTEDTPDRQKLYRWLPFAKARLTAFEILTGLDMAWIVLRAPRPDLILIIEHKHQYGLALYFACIIKRVPVLFFVHSIQQFSHRSIVHRGAFKLLQRLVKSLPFWPLHLECSDQVLPEKERFAKSIVVSHPLLKRTSIPRLPLAGRKIRIGVVGRPRADKPTGQLLEALLKFVSENEGYELVLGTPARQIQPELREKGISVMDTTTFEQYMQALESVDIVAVYYERDAYYFRPSGIINDAASAGCYVVAPDCPIFMAQISVPCRVGRVYRDLSKIDNIIQQAAEDLRSAPPDFAAWRNHRDDDKLLSDLGARMTEILKNRHSARA